MTDEEIEKLKAEIAIGNVFWTYDGFIRKCISVVNDYADPNLDLDRKEPVVFFPDGTHAALWNCDAVEFVRVVKVF